MASGAGLNRLGQNGGEVLLSLAPGATAVATPLTAYGTVGVPGTSNDSGAVMWEGIGFTKWVFQFIGGITGYTVTLYGTIDPAARPNGQPIAKGSTAIPATSWFVLPGPSEQGGTGTINNPITGTNPLFTASLPLVAVRAVVTAIATPTGQGAVIGFAVP
jgi:hypothetical protein